MLLVLVLRNSFLLRVKKLSWEDELAAYNGGQVSQHFQQNIININIIVNIMPPAFISPSG